jgi:hypothetical protein
MDSRRIEVIDMLLDILSIAVGTLLLTMSVLALYGLECEKSERRKRYMNGETDYYGNKIDE